MKLLAGTSLLVAGTACGTFAAIAALVAMPSALDGRAVLLLALALGGAAFGALGVRDLHRQVVAAHG